MSQINGTSLFVNCSPQRASDFLDLWLSIQINIMLPEITTNAFRWWPAVNLIINKEHQTVFAFSCSCSTEIERGWPQFLTFFYLAHVVQIPLLISVNTYTYTIIFTLNMDFFVAHWLTKLPISSAWLAVADLKRKLIWKPQFVWLNPMFVMECSSEYLCVCVFHLVFLIVSAVSSLYAGYTTRMPNIVKCISLKVLVVLM